MMFLKAQANSLIASLVDFLVTYLLGTVIGVNYLVASLLGTVCGAVTNFLIGQRWVFDAEKNENFHQALRYFISWCGYLLLSLLGVYILVNFFNVNYMLSKICVSLLLGFTYNYFMQKIFVFRK